MFTNTYQRISNIRDNLFIPFSKGFSILGLTPNMVTISGVIAMVFCIIYFQNRFLAIFFIAVSLFADLLDGSLARYQHVVSQNGRLFDIISDNLTFDIFITGMIYWEYIHVALGAMLILSTALSTIVSTKVAMRSARQAGGRFEETRGYWFLPHVVKLLFYLLFIISGYYSSITVTNGMAVISAIALVIFVLQRPGWRPISL